MNLLDFISNLWPSLVRGTIQGSAALIGVYLACRFMPRLPAWSKTWLWRLAWLRVIIAFITAASFSLAILPSPKLASVYTTFTASPPSEPQIEVSQ
jgi:hypothetical protein